MKIALFILLGFAFLTAGADILVRGAARLAAALGISALAIGLTIVAYGTSAPEMAVSVRAGLAGQADISLGNVVGSNLFNILIILGASALILPLVVSRQLVRFDTPVMVAATLLMWATALNGTIGRVEGALLLAGAAAYTALVLHMGRRQAARGEDVEVEEVNVRPARGWKGAMFSIFLVVAGLAVLVLGADMLVRGAADLARLMGASELVIGLTVVAVGTSLPEAATSLVAAIRRQRDIAIGNLVGSSIFNILVVLGAAAAASPTGVRVSPAALETDIPVAAGAAVVCMLIFLVGKRIFRLHGGILLFYYGAYMAFLILRATRHEALQLFSTVFVQIVLPVTLLLILLPAARRLSRPGK